MFHTSWTNAPNGPSNRAIYWLQLRAVLTNAAVGRPQDERLVPVDGNRSQSPVDNERLLWDAAQSRPICVARRLRLGHPILARCRPSRPNFRLVAETTRSRGRYVDQALATITLADTAYRFHFHHAPRPQSHLGGLVQPPRQWTQVQPFAGPWRSRHQRFYDPIFLAFCKTLSTLLLASDVRWPIQLKHRIRRRSQRFS